MKKTIGILGNYVIQIAFIVVSCMIGWAVLDKWKEFYPKEWGLQFLGVIVWIIAVIGIVYATKKIQNRVFIFSFLAILFLAQVIWIIQAKTQPISDFLYMLNGAKHIFDGDIAAVQGDDYFHWYTTQLGYPLLQVAIMRIAGANLVVLQLVNAGFITGTVYFLYKIAGKVVSETAGRITAILYGSYIGLFLLTPVLTNQHSSAFFIFLGIYLLLTDGFKEKLWVKIVAGAALGFGNAMYPIGVLFLLAIGLYLFFLYKDKDQFVSFKKTLIDLVVPILAYFGVLALFSGVILATGMADHGIQHYDNQWKFVLGLNDESNGQYSLDDFNKLLPSMLARDEQEHQKIEKKMIEERLADKDKLIKLMDRKYKLMWGSPTDSYSYAVIYPKDLPQKEAAQVWFVRGETIQYGAIVLLMIVSGVLLFFKAYKLEQLPYTIFQMVLVGGFLIYLVTEVQIRYRYFFIPLMVLTASYSLSQLVELVSKKKKVK